MMMCSGEYVMTKKSQSHTKPVCNGVSCEEVRETV